MARTGRIKRDGRAHYHVMSRTNGRRFLFGKGRTKAEMVGILRRTAEFSGVRLEAFCVMDDHFHVVCEVARPEGPVPEGEVLRRVGVLKGERFAGRLRGRWAEMRGAGAGAAADAELDGWRRRMGDVSEFAKTFKELVSIAWKAANRNPETYCGSIWSGRFRSTLVEGGQCLAACVRYVELNPVRAGMVTRARDYAYSSAGEAERDEAEGPVPGGWPERRVAQVGGGVVLGSRAFVAAAVLDFGDRWRGRPSARAVGGGCWSSHGHRLAREAERKMAEERRLRGGGCYGKGWN